MKYIICDLDGTLFNVDHRLHLLYNCREEKDYDKFHAEHINDSVNVNIADLIKAVSNFYYKEITIFFITGRHEKFRNSTMKQLSRLGFNDCVRKELFMKPSYTVYTTDFVKDFLNTLNVDKKDILFVLDDRPATVKIYRDFGLTCLQVKDSSGFIEDVKKDEVNEK